METQHNKLIEEKVAAFAAFQLGTFENGLHVPITREQQDEWLRIALSDLLATREAQMIEAVEKLPQRALCDDESKTQTGFECAVYVPLGLVDAALRPQQQEEVSN